MFFPIGTDRTLRRTPVVNYTLIVLNVGILLFSPSINRLVPIQQLYLWPTDPRLSGFFTYQFLHANWAHLLGNMLFLYVFGNGVEDRLGRVAYLCFYLGGGVIAGLAHCWTQSSPVLGASGSVAAVTGAFLALFPLSNVTIVYWFIIIGAFEISGMLLILFRIAQDVLFQLMGVDRVAYIAHIGGYGYGFAVAMGLLLVRLLPREPYDMLSLIEQRRRRSRFRRLARGGFQPWEGKAGGPAGGGPAKELTPGQRALMEQRTAIAGDLGRGDTPAAARRYAQLLRDDPAQVLSQQQQLDVANQLMADGHHDTAAAAYELFLTHYGSYPDRQQIQLILGLIYARYLDQPDRAKALLGQALPRLSGDDRQLAQRVLAELER